MKEFKEFAIKPVVNGFTGDKIKIDRILNKRIIIHAYKIEESKFKEKGNGKCLHMQIEIDGDKRIVFTGSVALMEIIRQVPPDGFPFKATIAKPGERFELQ